MKLYYIYAFNVRSQHIASLNHCLNCTSLCNCLNITSHNIHVSSKLQLFLCCLYLENNTVTLCLANNSNNNNNTIIIIFPSCLSLASLILNLVKQFHDSIFFHVVTLH